MGLMAFACRFSSQHYRDTDEHELWGTSTTSLEARNGINFQIIACIFDGAGLKKWRMW